jgi:hypothetical protein
MKEGRECKSCKEFKKWNTFDKKSSGKNGHDSRCRKCISKAKKKKRYMERLSKFSSKVTRKNLVDLENVIEKKYVSNNFKTYSSEMRRIVNDFVVEIIEGDY